MGGPVVHEDPGAAAATVNHNAVIQSRVEDVSRLHGLGDGEVSAGEATETSADEEVTVLVEQTKHEGAEISSVGWRSGGRAGHRLTGRLELQCLAAGRHARG